MGIFEWIGIGVLLAIVVLIALLIRRDVIARGGSILVSIRLSTYVDGRGWSPGIARFVGDEMHWYKVFSFAFRPRRVLNRQAFVIQQRRRPDAMEMRSLPSHTVVLIGTSRREPLELAMAESTVTGFMSWLEAAAPGTAPRSPFMR
jgi:hypothetical protein